MKMDSIAWLAICAGSALLLFSLKHEKRGSARMELRFHADGTRRRAAAYAPGEPAPSLDGSGGSRNAGPRSMRSGRETNWDEVAEASDESFPASDPPSYLPASI